MTNTTYYMYRHIRLDTNKVFYIGIGVKKDSKDFNSEYKRAFSKNRSDFWKKIIYKTNYKVEIVFEHLSYEFIKTKEKEFIKLYGRRDLKLGTLCNLTDGGEGTIGRFVSQESINKTASAHSILIYHKKTGEIFSSISEAAKKENIKSSHLSSLLIRQLPKCKYQYVNKELIKEYKNNLYLQILQKSTGKIFNQSCLIKELKIDKYKCSKILSNPDSDYKCLNKNFYMENKTKTKVLHLETNIIFNSIKEACNHYNKCNYNSFKSKVLKKINFEYVLIDKEGIALKNFRKDKTINQIESAKKVCNNYFKSEECLNKLNKKRCKKIIQISTGLIFSSIKDTCEFLKTSYTFFIYNIKNNLEFDYKYFEESLNVKKEFLAKINPNLRVSKNVNKTSKFTGIHWDKNRKKWTVTCRDNNKKRYFLGRFNLEMEALEVYNKFVEKLNKVNGK